MNLSLIVYGELDTVSGGYRYDRELLSALKGLGHRVSVRSLRQLPSPLAVLGGLFLSMETDRDHDLHLQDELCHPSLLIPNLLGRTRPAVAVVHHLRSSEQLSRLSRPFIEAIERAYLGTVEGFIFNSRATRASVEQLLGRSVDGVIAPPAWSGRAPNRRTGGPLRGRDPADPLRILFAGNLIRRKRLDSLLKAIAMLPKEDYRLRVAGDPSTDPRYAIEIGALIERLGLTAQVAMLGPLTENELAREYQSADVLAVVSQHEGFGRVYLEAHAYGLPVIGARSGGAAEIVIDGVTGWLVDPDEPVRIAEHLHDLRGQPDLWARMSSSARERFERHPTWPENAARIADYLEQFPSGSRPARSRTSYRFRPWKRRMSNE